MDWNVKSWDWENQELLDGKGTESSTSASVDSSSKPGVKISGFGFDAVGDFPKSVNQNTESKSGLGEPPIGLKLGKRTYFEDVCAGSNTKSSTSPISLAPSAALVRKSRVTHQSAPSSRCQVEDCDVDLSGAKDYHRKHRVCENHSKCHKVVVAGQVRRFCQQCSRFHDLSEFDQKKRSCRKRLSDHNARRRKPASQVISFSSPRLASPFYDLPAPCLKVSKDPVAPPELRSYGSEKGSKPEEQTNTATLIEQMAKMMTQMAAMQAAAMSNPQPVTHSVAITEGGRHSKPIDVKMDGTNYTYWCQAIEMYVKGRERMRHLTGTPAPPGMNDPEFSKWEVDDVIVKGWLINSLEPRLQSKYIRHPTARDVWKALETTYYDGSDEVQVFSLNRRVTRLKQEGKNIEEFYDELQALWQEIDFRCPNPMDTPNDIEKFNLFIQKARVYTFLDGLEDRFDAIRAQVLQLKPFPTIEQAFGHVRHEATRQSVMMKEYNDATTNSLAMATKGYRSYEVNPNSTKKFGFTDKSKLKCSNCGGTRHTREGCFELIGYPDWWKDPRKKKQGDNSRGRASLVVSREPQQTGVKETDNLSHVDRRCVAATTQVRREQTDHTQAPDTAQTYCATGTDQGEQGKGKSGTKCMLNNSSKNMNWVIDSGATDHMTYEDGEFREIRKPHKTGIINANGEMYPATGSGDIYISPRFTLNNVLLVPSLSTKLMSISQLTEDLNCVAIMYPNHCEFQDILSGETIGRGTKRNGLYYLEELKTGRACLTSEIGNVQRNKVLLWHKRLGHPSFGYMKKISPHLFPGLNNEDFICETCIKAKSHRTSFGNSLNKCVEPFELIHTDVWGPSPVISKSGGKWYVIFVDDCTRMTWLYILKTKDEVPKIFQNFHKMITIQFGKKIKMVRSDNGTEYINRDLQSFFSENGILHETSCVGTPQQNGVAERKNRHLLEITRSLLFENKVPASFWDNAVSFAVYLMNRMPTTANNFQTPLQSLSSHVHIPSILNLPPRVFGCSVYVHIQKHSRNKLESRAEKCVFLGCGQFQKGYKCYNTSTRKFYVTMDVTFLENEAYFRQNHDLAQGESENDQDLNFLQLSQPIQATNSDLCCDIAQPKITEPNQDQTRPASGPQELDSDEGAELDSVQNAPAQLQVYTRRNKQTNLERDENEANQWEEREENEEEIIQSIPTPPVSPQNEPQVRISEQRYTLPNRKNRGIPPARYVPEDGTNSSVNYPISNYTCTKLLPDPLKAFVNQLSSITIPEKVEDAMKEKKWIQAMKTEMNALEKNSTWELVELPEDKHVIGCKWVYSIKYNEKGEVERYKARLVAKGYTQTYGIDFQETFSPVAKLNTIRVILSLAANFDWPLHQFDVKNAFLHGDLEEEIYMEIPPGYLVPETRNKVCKLNKALYGLKQSPRAWFGRFCDAMRSYGYIQGDSDHTLFFKRAEGKITILIIYVDDMIITGDNLEEIKRLEQKLSGDFEMKNLGGLKYFLGIEVSRNKNGIFLSQRKYVLDLLTEVGMLECKPADTPSVKNIKLDVNRSNKSVNKERYQRLVGKLIYLSHTRPDIAYAVSIVSQFMHNPAEEHMEAVMRIIRYLKGTPGRGIKFVKHGHTEIIGYTDADWAGNIIDRKSTAGYFTFVGGNLVTWRSKKQNVVALSSAEAEFRGMVKGVCELLWLKKLVVELGFKPEKEMQLFCDNKAAIDISHNPVQHDRTKHIEVDRHFIKEKLDSGIISLPFVRSQEQVADILTKAVGSKEFDDALIKIGMEDIYVSKRGGVLKLAL